VLCRDPPSWLLVKSPSVTSSVVVIGIRMPVLPPTLSRSARYTSSIGHTSIEYGHCQYTTLNLASWSFACSITVACCVHMCPPKLEIRCHGHSPAPVPFESSYVVVNTTYDAAKRRCRLTTSYMQASRSQCSIDRQPACSVRVSVIYRHMGRPWLSSMHVCIIALTRLHPVCYQLAKAQEVLARTRLH